MKGIILAGGSGTRLDPITRVISKQLLPVYDKPMIYYPLSILMFAGIREILIITAPKDKERFINLLGDGKQFGINIRYCIQEKPRGIAEAFILGEEFIDKDSVCLILGDNIFYGEGLPKLLQQLVKTKQGATIFGYYVKDPGRYGVAEISKDGKIQNIEEKPQNPKSNWAITGLYIYDNQVVDITKNLKLSKRGELEITDLNKEYLKINRLNIEFLGRGIAWFDAGTAESLIAAQNFVEAIETRQGLKIACPEEIAYRMGYISLEQLKKLATAFSKSEYGQYLRELVERPDL